MDFKGDEKKKEKLYRIISNALNIDFELVNDELAIGAIPEWDSLGHLAILSAIEKEYEIELDVDQTLEIEEVIDIWEMLHE